MSDTPPAATTCCIVGGGPAGVILALLLVRQGIDVVLLESHKDFDRDFRGDTVHPPTLELLDQLGLADRLLALPHAKARTFTLPGGAGAPISLEILRTRFPYVAMMSQAILLDFLAREAAASPHMKLIFGAAFQELIVEDDRVVGVRYRKDGAQHELRALLTVGADGRASRVRRSAGLEPIRSSQAIDVLWFRLPHLPQEGAGFMGRVHDGRILIYLDRGDEWQIGYLLAKGGYAELRAQGIEAFRRGLVEADPALADRVHLLADWKDLSLLNVEASRLPRWYRAGLLLIGDAAHVMSPVGGVGINYAVQDAVAAANELTGPLRAGRVELRDLARVQREREWPTRVIQLVQGVMQRQLMKRAMDRSRPFTPPFFLRLRPLVRFPLRLLMYGVRTTRLRQALREAAP